MLFYGYIIQAETFYFIFKAKDLTNYTMEKKYIVAFDQGTTSTRAIIFDKKGSIVSICQKELQQ